MEIDKSYDFIVHGTDGALKRAFNTLDLTSSSAE